MSGSNSRLRNRLLFGLLLLTVCCSGCSKADVLEFITYDRPTDTFRYLQLDLNIAGESASDLNYLDKLYGERDRIIMYPEVWRFFSLPAILRVDNHHYRQINLGAESGKDNPTLATTIPLDTVKIEPGKFFITADHTLAYYQVVTASGAVVDQALAHRNKVLFGHSFVAAIDEELQRRAKGGTAESWDAMRKLIDKAFDEKEVEEAKRAGSARGEKPAKSPAHKQAAPLGRAVNKSAAAKSAAAKKPETPRETPQIPLDVESLEKLRKAAAAGELGFHRHGSVLEIAFPLSAADLRQAKITVDLWKARSVKYLKTKPGDFGPALSTMLHAEIDGSGRLVLTVNVRLLSKIEEQQLADCKPDPKSAANYRDAIAALRAHKIPIDDKLKVRQIIDGFEGKQ